MPIRSTLLAWSSGAVVMALADLVVPAAGHAAEPASAAVDDRSPRGELRLTWPEVVQRVDAHPALAAGQQRAAAARAGVAAAGAIPNPSLEATTAHGRARDASASGLEWGLALSFPFDWVAGRGARLDAAGAEARATEAEAAAVRRELLLQLRLMFIGLVHAQERVEALAALDRETAALAAAVQRRVEVGEVRPVEATRVQVEAATIGGELATARAAIGSRQAQLGLWLGAGATRIVAVDDLARLPGPLAIEAARAGVRQRHPSLRAAEARAQALAAEAALERRARVPALTAQAFTDHALDRSAYGVGLALEVPLWDWNSGNIERAEALRAAGRSQVDVERLALEGAVLEAQAACQAAVALAGRYRDEIQPGAASAAQTIERTYQIGEATLLELLDARRTLLTTRTQTLAAFAQAQAECSRLHVLAGEDLP